MIQDSGNRREFESGAVRDMAEGKGRCDLLPLLDVANVLYDLKIGSDPEIVFIILSGLVDCVDEKKDFCERYQKAITVLRFFSDLTGDSIYKMMLEVAIHYEEGAKKYEETGKRVFRYGVSLILPFAIFLSIWMVGLTNVTTELLFGTCLDSCSR